MAALAPDFMPDWVPPGHGEPDYSSARWGIGSNVYTDEQWHGVLTGTPAFPYPPEEVDF